MHVLFNMRWLLDTFTPNFTITRQFNTDNITIYEYVYGSKRYFTDIWPPNTRHKGFPIKKVIREDGVDVTVNVLKFSGPLRNYVNPLGTSIMKKGVSINCHNLGLHFEIINKFDKYYIGTVNVTDIFGNLKIIHIE